MARVAVLVFPGSNCDHDVYHAAKHVFGQDARFVWHKEGSVGDADLVVVPGGFSYGDYLRAGAIARFSPVMRDVVRFAGSGGLVLGVCNGFQVLCEAGLLPGALVRNASLRFACRDARLRVENARTPFTSGLEEGEVLTVPVAHGEGNYTADEETLDELEAEGRVVFRYVDERGEAAPAASPNGSVRNIAGVVSAPGNVLGMMPHPERCGRGRAGPGGRGPDLPVGVRAPRRGGPGVAPGWRAPPAGAGRRADGRGPHPGRARVLSGGAPRTPRGRSSRTSRAGAPCSRAWPRSSRSPTPAPDAFLWQMDPLGPPGVQVRTVYACRYRRQPGPALAWTPVEGVGNARFGGAVRLAARDGGTAGTLRLEAALEVPAPRFARAVVEPAVALEMGRMTDTFLVRLDRALGG